MLVRNRVYLERDLPSKELIQAFHKIPAVVIEDYMGRNCTLHHSIRLMSRPVKDMCRPALAIQSREGDNLFFYKTSGMAQEGNVIVIATSLCDTNSIANENVVANATLKRLEDLIFNTPIRDIKGISKMELPVYTTGIVPGRPYKSAPGEINVPTSCGSYSIYPEDIIVRDMDGVMVAPLGDVKAVLEAAQKYYVADIHSQEGAVADSWDHE